MTAQTARITPGNARLTPGKRLRRTLNKALAAGCEWTEVELITLDLIEAAADRAAALEAHLAVELAKPVLSRRRWKSLRRSASK
jgi:hypothetical protein